MASVPTEEFREESIWFGTTDRPLFGRLALPGSKLSRGGVLLSPPIGREGRLARRALRGLAISLAMDGFASLRFDHFGTGDSSGSLDDDEFDHAWQEGVDQGVALLRSLEVPSVSAVGMRMGATILGTSAAAYDLRLSSLVLWDPCESGRAYLRELSALGAARRVDVASESSSPTMISEYVYSDVTAKRLSELSLTASSRLSLADRVLVVVRDDRVVSSKFRKRWENEHVEWIETSEQGPLLEAELPSSVHPSLTITQIRNWLSKPSSSPAPLRARADGRDTVTMKTPSGQSVRESFVKLGPLESFGIVSEPVSEARGPLIVMVNGIHEDHVGPSRIWVELSRHWAELGLRSLRFDFGGWGESPWRANALGRSVYSATRSDDIRVAIKTLNPTNPADSVLIGLCSGAQLVVEVALELKSRGICVINPAVGTGVRRIALRLDISDRALIRSFATRTKNFLKLHRWVSETMWQVTRLVVSTAYSPRARSTLVSNGSEILLLTSRDDISPFRRIPILRSIDHRRLVSSEHCRVEIVPDLDHHFLNAVGRARAVAILDQHVVEKFAGPHNI
ncbi:MAG TPA: alpha/beta hydrolase family protein [Acidimicrobiales bacterium]|nr:alpha/beta hydrolase family protein [Acidimicrobiales bacterium]